MIAWARIICIVIVKMNIVIFLSTVFLSLFEKKLTTFSLHENTCGNWGELRLPSGRYRGGVLGSQDNSQSLPLHYFGNKTNHSRKKSQHGKHLLPHLSSRSGSTTAGACFKSKLIDACFAFVVHQASFCSNKKYWLHCSTLEGNNINNIPFWVINSCTSCISPNERKLLFSVEEHNTLETVTYNGWPLGSTLTTSLVTAQGEGACLKTKGMRGWRGGVLKDKSRQQ